jgi:DNA replication protein DnaC
MNTMINPMPELEQSLKKLRLSGMLESLAIRNKEAIEGKLTYPEFLAQLIQDEMLRRERNQLSQRMRRAGFLGDKTIESFDFSYNPNLNAAEIKEVASGQFIREKRPVILVGPCGTGKSHLAKAIGYAAIQQGVDVIFLHQSQLMNRLDEAKATGDYIKRINQLAKVPLLIIDDFALQPLRTPHDEYFYDLINERYEKTATLITSNLAIHEWQEALTNKMMGAAVADRLRHNGYHIELNGRSYRQS